LSPLVRRLQYNAPLFLFVFPPNAGSTNEDPEFMRDRRVTSPAEAGRIYCEFVSRINSASALNPRVTQYWTCGFPVQEAKWL
jgi:hypothetical protein